MLTHLRLSPLARLLLNVEDEGGAGGGGTGGTGGVTFTPEQQAHIDSLMGRTRAEATRAAERTAGTAAETKLAEQLGCTVDEAKTRLAALDAAEEANKTEVQRAQDAATAAENARLAAERDRDEALAAAKTAAATAAMSTALLATDGFDKTQVGNALKLVAIDPEDDEAAIAAKVAALKAEIPAFFTAVAAPAPAGGPGRTPPAPKPPAGGQGGAPESEYARGARLARSSPLARV